VTNANEVRKARSSLIRFMVGSGGLVGSFVMVFVVMSIVAARRAG